MLVRVILLHPFLLNFVLELLVVFFMYLQITTNVIRMVSIRPTVLKMQHVSTRTQVMSVFVVWDLLKMAQLVSVVPIVDN